MIVAAVLAVISGLFFLFTYNAGLPRIAHEQSGGAPQRYVDSIGGRMNWAIVCLIVFAIGAAIWREKGNGEKRGGTTDQFTQLVGVGVLAIVVPFAISANSAYEHWTPRHFNTVAVQPTPAPSAYHPPTEIQAYWYCWDDQTTGPPHHLGHRVLGDHLCTYGELDSLGWPTS